MASPLAPVRRAPLLSFFVLACALTWSCVLLAPVSPAFGLLGLFGPSAAAVIVTAAGEGRAGVRTLLARVLDWRVRPAWYAVALGLPFVLTGAAALLHLLLGGAGPFPLYPIGVLSIVLAVLVVGEEIGWRGYALPRLTARFGVLGASLILGLLWACWHLANSTIPGLERYWTAFPAFLFFVVAQTFLFTWIAGNTGAASSSRGSSTPRSTRRARSSCSAILSGNGGSRVLCSAQQRLLGWRRSSADMRDVLTDVPAARVTGKPPVWRISASWRKSGNRLRPRRLDA